MIKNMRRVGTLTSACTMLALGLLLFLDTLRNSNAFLKSLDFWPLLLLGLGVEILFTWLLIRRKKSAESIRLDGRSLALLLLVGVFSISFYQLNVRVAKGAVEPPQVSIFSVGKKNMVLPAQQVAIPKMMKQMDIKNPYGKIDVVGTSKPNVSIEAVAHVASLKNQTPESVATQLTPFVEQAGDKTTIAVHVPDAKDKTILPGTVDLRVEVPQHLQLSIEDSYGDVSLTQYQGNTNVLVKVGTITVDTLHGSIKATNQNGPISVNHVYGDVNLNTQQGGFTALNIVGNLSGKSASGSCTIQNLSGRLELTQNMGPVEMDNVWGDIVVNSTSGLLTIQNPHASVMSTVTNGDIKVAGGLVEAPWTMNTTHGKVELDLPKNSSIKFLGETNQGVIKGPTLQSPTGGTRRGAYLTEQMGSGEFPVTVRCDDGSIFVELQ